MHCITLCRRGLCSTVITGRSQPVGTGHSQPIEEIDTDDLHTLLRLCFSPDSRALLLCSDVYLSHVALHTCVSCHMEEGHRRRESLGQGLGPWARGYGKSPSLSPISQVTSTACNAGGSGNRTRDLSRRGLALYQLSYPARYRWPITSCVFLHARYRVQSLLRHPSTPL